MNKLKALVACEESQAVCIELRKLGWEAYSCDIQECSGGHPEWHICEDVLPLLNGDCVFKTTDGQMHKIQGKWDIVISFPPCFVAGTKVMTFDGEKSIEDIKVGDYVLTHKGRYKRVLDTMQKPANKTVVVKAENLGTVECTPNHPFYVQNISSKLEKNKDKVGRVRKSTEFEWLPPTDFIAKKSDPNNSKSHYIEKTYLTSVVDACKEMPQYDGVTVGVNGFIDKKVCDLNVVNTDFWYIAGRWVGDGWFYYKKINGDKCLYGVIICCGKTETNELKEKLDKAGFKYYLGHEKTTDKFEIYNKELALYLSQFGKGASGKFIPGFVTRLPDDLAHAFLKGYMDADGYCNKNGVCSFHTVSANLAYGVKYMINKYYNVACSIRYEENRNVIEGRVCNAKNIYRGVFREQKHKQTHYINYDHYILAPFISVTEKENPTTVYNLSVEDDESYTANGIVVHNCTHLAVSGARHFEVKRADGRQREGIEFFCKFLTADCDRIIIENPVGIMSGDYITTHFPDLAEKYGLPRKPTQIIHPWMFGDNYAKSTCLWIKGLEPLIPEVTEEPEMEYLEWVDKKTGKTKRQAKWYCDALKLSPEERAKVRSKTFPGVARAIATQITEQITKQNDLKLGEVM